MIFTQKDIRKFIDSGKLKFTPSLDEYQYQPHAVDLRLGTVFYIPKIWKLTDKGREILTVDVTNSDGNNYEKISLKPGQYFELSPGESVIASTLEKIEMDVPDLMGVLYPRSSVNRRGLSVDLTGIIDVFYSGYLMIPVLNKTVSQVIRIYPGERICQVVFHRLTDGLDKKEAMIHGKVPAKYHRSGAMHLMAKKDDEKEITLIKSGKLKNLKAHE